MTLLDQLNTVPPRPEEEIAEAMTEYRLMRVDVRPTEFLVIFPNGDTEALHCTNGVITGFERWQTWITPTLRRDIEQELRDACAC